MENEGFKFGLACQVTFQTHCFIFLTHRSRGRDRLWHQTDAWVQDAGVVTNSLLQSQFDMCARFLFLLYQHAAIDQQPVHTHERSTTAPMHSHKTSSQSACMCNLCVCAPAGVDVLTSPKVIVVNRTSKVFCLILACWRACLLYTSMKHTCAETEHM